MIENNFFKRRVLGIKNRGCRTDPVTSQTVQSMPHSGDLVYELQGEDAIAKKSEYRVPTRERILNPILEVNLNEVGEDKTIIKRTKNSRYVKKT